uniref:Uncharacterized protein n=1 Tax=Glossina palpalis gambiensis TaxID=67801 RepID=A0A1B0C3N9_9MUSC
MANIKTEIDSRERNRLEKSSMEHFSTQMFHILLLDFPKVLSYTMENRKAMYEALSKLLCKYSKLWRPWAASTNRQFKELTCRLSSEPNRGVAMRWVITILKCVRLGLKRLEGGSVRIRYTAYLWNAHELGYKRVVETINKQIERDRRLSERLRVKVEGFFGLEEGLLDGGCTSHRGKIEVNSDGDTSTDWTGASRTPASIQITSPPMRRSHNVQRSRLADFLEAWTRFQSSTRACLHASSQ